MTDIGIMIFSVTCIRFIAAMKSLTGFDVKKNALIIVPGAKRVMTEQTPSVRKDANPDMKSSAKHIIIIL